MPEFYLEARARKERAWRWRLLDLWCTCASVACQAGGISASRLVGLQKRPASPVQSAQWIKSGSRQPGDVDPPGGGLRELSEVEGGLVAVGEADDHAGGPADGLEVGVEGGQEQVVGLFHAADGGLGDAEPAG